MFWRLQVSREGHHTLPYSIPHQRKGEGLLLLFDGGHHGPKRLTNFHKVTSPGGNESFWPYPGWKDTGVAQVWVVNRLSPLVSWDPGLRAIQGAGRWATSCIRAHGEDGCDGIEGMGGWRGDGLTDGQPYWFIQNWGVSWGKVAE